MLVAVTYVAMTRITGVYLATGITASVAGICIHCARICQAAPDGAVASGLFAMLAIVYVMLAGVILLSRRPV
jgi:hypothetical protein